MSKAETAYRTIAEVSELLQVPASVLRFWESQFTQLKPMKRMGRRYYSAEDVVLLARIRDDLYKEGFTIKGVQKRLKNQHMSEEESSETSACQNRTDTDKLIQELVEIRDYLSEFI